ncbi:MAG: hypothetical protein DBX55_02555 [Verrucomicrobia bacterium]|nr:MAG: hypothetical protein DBX55_02555 [Verrucomicrobiota bacterium]
MPQFLWRNFCVAVFALAARGAIVKFDFIKLKRRLEIPALFRGFLPEHCGGNALELGGFYAFFVFRLYFRPPAWVWANSKIFSALFPARRAVWRRSLSPDKKPCRILFYLECRGANKKYSKG